MGVSLCCSLRKGKDDTKWASEFLRTVLPLLGARLFLPQLPRVGPPLLFLWVRKVSPSVLGVELPGGNLGAKFPKALRV